MKRKRKLPAGVGDGSRSTARAAVWSDRFGVWHHQVVDSEGKVVNWDCAGDWRVIFDSAFEAVRAVRQVENMGHRLLHDYDYLVDNASI